MNDIGLTELIKTVGLRKFYNEYHSTFYVSKSLADYWIIWIVSKHYSDINAKNLMGDYDSFMFKRDIHRWFKGSRRSDFDRERIHESDINYHICIDENGNLKFVSGRIHNDRFGKLISKIITNDLKIRVNETELLKLERYYWKRDRVFQHWLRHHNVLK